MTETYLYNVLLRSLEIHSQQSKMIDFSVNDKKHAIYLLQGGAMTSVASAYKFFRTGMYVPCAQQKRMLDEILNLIMFFDENEENDRQLRAWFDGRVIERQPGNAGNLSIEERAKRYYILPEQVKTLDELMERMNAEMSKYMHPTINAIRSNMSKSKHLFDYHHTYTYRQPSMSPYDFGVLYMVPAINTLLVPIRNLLLPQNYFDELYGYSKTIQSSKIKPN